MLVNTTGSFQATRIALENLPQFPPLASKLLNLLSFDDSDVKAIVNLIRIDPAISTELLRVVNSPLYRLRGRVGSIQSAIALLGFNTVKSIALTVSMRAFFQTPLNADLLRVLWRHSLSCALICEELSSACSPVHQSDDRAYTMGLLHDIGRLALFVRHPRQYAELLNLNVSTVAETLDLERSAFGMNHCEAGAWLAQHWGLPEEIQQVMARHHEPVNTSNFTLLDSIKLGVLLADEIGFDAVPARHGYTMADIERMSPDVFWFRFDGDVKALKTRVAEKLQALD